MSCSKHSSRHWVESILPGRAGYCKACVDDRYRNARRCPHCGEKAGFSMGTGDCGCESSPDVGW